MAAAVVISPDELSQHNTKDDLWVAIDGTVYDLTSFSSMHPGGLPPLKEVAGQECTDAFYALHRAEVLRRPRYDSLKVGTLKGWDHSDTDTQMPAPYGEAFGFWRKQSPYYNESHHTFRMAIRAFFNREVRPFADDWDSNDTLPSKELMRKCGRAGLIACLVASEPNAVQFLRKWGIQLPGGLDPLSYDPFHGLILAEEMRYGCNGCYGVSDGLLGGISIGLPPLIKFGTEWLIETYVRPIIMGEKRICLAISEAFAGSDVAKIRTKGVLGDDGVWTVTGTKKWITGGHDADYFSTLVRTDSHGMCMMLLERDEDEEQLQTRRIKTSYSGAAGTSYVEINECRVPMRNVIGELGRGFYHVMANFNIERWGMVCGGNRHARMVYEECFKWASQRRVFGKPLISQPLIRFKLAQMIAEIETVHSMLEDVTYQMTKMTEKELDQYLAGTISLLKYKQTRAATLVSDNACQIFGGRAVTRTGMGAVVEKFQKSFKFMAILGGSEEIMADFAIRQAVKRAKKEGMSRL